LVATTETSRATADVPRARSEATRPEALLPFSSRAGFFKSMKGNNRSTSYSLALGPAE
jgi:hypothetical protein